MECNFSTRDIVPTTLLMPGSQVAKRTFDVLFALLVTVLLLSWLVPLLALLIKLDSPGSVFFRQLRTGKNGQPFWCLKLRTMRDSEHAHHQQAFRGDPRITRLGAMLRQTSLDELPQFFNVLRGEMSVVGPRPHMLTHTATYSVLIDEFMVRHTVMPGITGLAQVAGHRGETRETQAMAQRVQADLLYIQNWSLLLDLKIVLLTVFQAVKGHRNAF